MTWKAKSLKRYADKGQVMKHICDTMRDYTDALQTCMQEDVIYCSQKLWNQIVKLQPERLSEKDPEKDMRQSEQADERA